MKFIVTTILLLVLMIMPVFSQQDSRQNTKQEDHEKIVETVGVNWWRVPLVAVDSKGNAIFDLKNSDVNVTVNGKIITRFTLLNRTYGVSQTVRIETPAKEASVSKAKQPEEGKRTVVLLFDLNLSDAVSIHRSRKTARAIIAKADPETRFVLMTIEPFTGLKFISENKGDRKELLKMINKQVTPRSNQRLVSYSDKFIPSRLKQS